jgi:predicted amidophosphoribosyltransferase
LDDGVRQGLLFGVGAAYAMLMAPPMFKAFAPPRQRETVIVCLNCSAKNPEKNRYCGNCGKPLYPSMK